MATRMWIVALCLSPAAPAITGCGECSGCDLGPIPPAYVRVQTATSTGPLGGLAVRLERQGYVAVSATTGALGTYTFEALDPRKAEIVTVIAEPSVEYTTPAPHALFLIPSDTVDVQLLLEAAP